MFIVADLVSLKFCVHLAEEERASCFNQVLAIILVLILGSLSHGAMGWDVFCDWDISG